MTRSQDVAAAVGLGARYIGVIFAGGPRAVSVERAGEVLAGVPAGVGRVGVFGREGAAKAAPEIASRVGLDVVQLHEDPTPADVERTRASFGGAVWAVLRVRGDQLPPAASELFATADAVVLDAYSATALGGTGIPLEWGALADAVAAVRQAGRLVLAGGLRPETVGDALRALRPDVVDVSSGVEAAPGIKDHAKLRAFRDAVHREPART